MDTNKIKISVRDTQQYIFPFINYGTILVWIKKGILVPNTRHKTHQGPDPIILLDKLDLVTIALLHGLFTFGVGYKDVGGVPHPKRLLFKSVVLDNFDFSVLVNGTLKIPSSMTLKKGRQIQEFLLNNNYNVIVFWAPEVEAKESQILFYPASFEIEHKERISSITDLTHCSLGTTFIYAKQWEQYVDHKLQGMTFSK